METSEQDLPRKAAKIFFITFVFIIIAIVGYVAGALVKYRLDVRKADRSVERFQGALEQPYKDDTYGGKTPEETWAMYIDAQKKGDIDLASKYFAVNKQEEWKKILADTQKAGKLETVIKNLSGELKKDPTNDLENEKAYYQEVKDEQRGEVYKSPIRFYLNPYTKVWKIVSL